MHRSSRLTRAGGPAAASLLVNGLIVGALLGLQIGADERPAPSRLATLSTFAVSKGSEAGEEAAKAPPAAAAAPSSVVRQPVASAPPPTSPPLVVHTSAPFVMLPTAPTLPASSSPSSPAAGALAPATASSAISHADGTPAPAALGRGVADGVDVAAPAGTSRSYAARVRSWLYAHKIYPRRARMRREEGLVQVRFVLDRDGVLIDGAVTRRSGIASLDDEAKAMLHRSSPYPRPPAELPGERIEFTAPIEFALPS